MNSKLAFAIKCFDENIELSNPKTNGLEYNHYQGLSSLAEALAQIEMQIQSLSQQVQYLQTLIRK